ncbi:MAG: glycosyltransferase, partial [Nitrososphaeria archaeon]
MIDIVFITSASLSLPVNPRARKIVKTLSSKFRILVLEWDREKIRKPFEIMNKRVFIKRFRLKASYGVFYLPLLWPFFWSWIIVNIVSAKPKIIHACNLDALIPSWISRLLFFKKPKIVFDSFDKFSLAFIPPKYRLCFKMVDILENILTCNSDAFITVSKERLKTYGKFIPNFVEIIMNCPEDLLSRIDDLILNSKKSKELILVYAGGLSRDRGLTLLKEAISSINDVKLYLAGNIVDNTIKKLLSSSKIKYLGLLPYEESIKLQAQADVIPILYDPAVPINFVANPNKLFEAMMLGKPVITNVCRDIVEETNCGIVVDYSPEQVRNAILQLKNNPSLRSELGKNGRKAFEEKYNWSIMEKN